MNPVAEENYSLIAEPPVDLLSPDHQADQLEIIGSAIEKGYVLGPAVVENENRNEEQDQGEKSESLLADIIQALEGDGYIEFEAPFSREQLNRWYEYARKLPDVEFKPAGIGRQLDFQLDQQQRRDSILWLENDEPLLQPYFDWMDTLRVSLNRTLFLGLFDYECHFAKYSSGDFYKKHVDAFSGTSNRKVSSVFYLNETWTENDGGELVVYDPVSDKPIKTIRPESGKMVLFLSEVFPHEVLPTRKERFSLTGWFRINGSIGGQIDPPV